MLQTVRDTIRRAGKNLGLDDIALQNIIDLEHEHEFIIKLQDGSKYQAYRMQHNSTRGPYKGGIRFHPEVGIDEVRELATLMTLKTAIANIPMGGGKGGIIVDPKLLSAQQLEELSRGYVRGLSNHIGPQVDVPAPDVNTNAQIMDWMVDEYSKLTGDITRASFTGKSIENGGSKGRPAATGRGGYLVLATLLDLEKDNEPKAVAVQGFGNVGSYFSSITLSNKKDWQLVAVSDSSGGIRNDAGFDAEVLTQFKATGGRFKDYDSEGVVHFEAEDIISQDCDVLVLAALGGVITEDNQEKVSAKMIVELANGPIDGSSADALETRGVVIVPDVLANSGGVIVSYLEWKQNLDQEQWELDRVEDRLRQHIVQATNQVYEKSVAEQITLRDAAYVVALERLKGD